MCVWPNTIDAITRFYVYTTHYSIFYSSFESVSSIGDDDVLIGEEVGLV